MPDWALPEFSEVADVLSVVGFMATCWVAFQTKKIRSYFFNRVRIGEILPELTKEADDLLLALKAWEANNGSGRDTHMVLSRLKGRLLNLKKKIDSDDKKTLVQVLAKIDRKKLYLFPSKITDITQDEAWEIATVYAGMISQVTGSHNDLTWRQQ